MILIFVDWVGRRVVNAYYSYKTKLNLYLEMCPLWGPTLPRICGCMDLTVKLPQTPRGQHVETGPYNNSVGEGAYTGCQMAKFFCKITESKFFFWHWSKYKIEINAHYGGMRQYLLFTLQDSWTFLWFGSGNSVVAKWTAAASSRLVIECGSGIRGVAITFLN
jgi:hypothetical protein